MLCPGLLLHGVRQIDSESCHLCTCQLCFPVQGKSKGMAVLQVTWKSLQEIEICVIPAAVCVDIQTDMHNQQS